MGKKSKKSGAKKPDEQANMVNSNKSIVPHPVFKKIEPECVNLLMSDLPKIAPATPVVFDGIGTFRFGEVKAIPPPQPNDSTDESAPMVSECKPIPPPISLSKSEAKEALEEWSKQKCGRSSQPANNCEVISVQCTNAFVYMLETFTEKRSLVCNFARCRPGEAISPPQGTSVPDPWSITSSPSAKFINNKVLVKCPFTDVLQPCFRCNSYGKLRCSNCNGKGRRKCNMCGGDGRVRHVGTKAQQVFVKCTRCDATGSNDCARCVGGAINCDACNGAQMLKWFLQIRIDYINHVDEYINERTKLPDELVKNYSGTIHYEFESAHLLPISNSNSDELNENSSRLIQDSKQAYSREKLLRQRHLLKTIAVTECECALNDKKFRFWIVGQERAVLAPDYPNSYCFQSCTIS